MRFRFEVPDEHLTVADRFNEATFETAFFLHILLEQPPGNKLRVISFDGTSARVHVLIYRRTRISSVRMVHHARTNDRHENRPTFFTRLFIWMKDKEIGILLEF